MLRFHQTALRDISAKQVSPVSIYTLGSSCTMRGFKLCFLNNTLNCHWMNSSGCLPPPFNPHFRELFFHSNLCCHCDCMVSSIQFGRISNQSRTRSAATEHRQHCTRHNYGCNCSFTISVLEPPKFHRTQPSCAAWSARSRSSCTFARWRITVGQFAVARPGLNARGNKSAQRRSARY
jgi:hypothetical protein